MSTQVFNLNIYTINCEIKKKIFICRLYLLKKNFFAKAGKLLMQASMCVDSISFIKITDTLSLEDLYDVKIMAWQEQCKNEGI